MIDATEIFLSGFINDMRLYGRKTPGYRNDYFMGFTISYAMAEGGW